MLPLLIAAGAAKMAGPLVGSFGNIQDIQRGMTSYKNLVGQGTDVMNAGKEASTQSYSPYTSVGSQAIGNQANAIYGRQQAATPTLSNTSAAGVGAFLDPSMNFSIDQANKSLQGKGIASGAMGGGLAKAVSNNANQMAQTGWQNAYKNMIDTNNQNFGQQQQNYANNNDYQQQQIQNIGGLAAQGLNANTANQQLQSGYNTNINQNYRDIAANNMAGWVQKGGLFNSAFGGGGGNLGELMSAISGKIG